jgi:hypothetical protein
MVSTEGHHTIQYCYHLKKYLFEWIQINFSNLLLLQTLAGNNCVHVELNDFFFIQSLSNVCTLGIVLTHYINVVCVNQLFINQMFENFNLEIEKWGK